MKKAYMLLAFILVFAFIFVSCGNGNGDKETTTSSDTESSTTTTEKQEIPSPGENYVKIESAEDFLNIKNDLEGNYYLVADINLGGVEITPLGTESKPFAGILQGNGFTVSNFKILRSYTCIGLFGYNEGTISNLSVQGFEITVNYNSYGDGAIGGLVGYNAGEIYNCAAGGAIDISSHENVILSTGGFVGYNAGTIKYSFANGNVSANAGSIEGEGKAEDHVSLAGGFVGYNEYEIANCYATGNVDSISRGVSAAGGFVGYGVGVIANSYSFGTVRAISSSYATAGGFAGELASEDIVNCLAIGDVNATVNSENGEVLVGGFAGYSEYEELDNCYHYGVQKIYVNHNGTVTTVPHTTIGTSCTADEINSPEFYIEKLDWNPDIWDFSEFNFGISKFITLK